MSVCTFYQSVVFHLDPFDRFGETVNITDKFTSGHIVNQIICHISAGA